MKLKNKYVIGTLVQFYELEMIEEHVLSCVKMLDRVENKENVTFVFCFSTQQYLEKIDWEYFENRYGSSSFASKADRHLQDVFENKVRVGGFYPANHIYQYKTDKDDFYNIAAFRREFTWEWSDKADIILWGECDSLWPSQTLQVLDHLHEEVKQNTPKYIVNFSDRRLWDNSFAPLHPKYENVPFVDDEEWQFNSPDSGKGYMSFQQMEDINSVEDVNIIQFSNPRFDGSCVGFTSDLLKSGVTIPKSLIHNSEDVSIGKIAKQLLGDNFVQYNINNILHVHNRRHPKKRTGVLGENNPSGKCTTKDKGEWWDILERSSKKNFSNLLKQEPFVKLEVVMDQIKQISGE